MGSGRKVVSVLLVLIVFGIPITFYFEKTSVIKGYLLPPTFRAAFSLDLRHQGLCDEDCTRFRSLMSNSSAWSDNRPRSVVIVLIGRRDNAIPSLGIHGGIQMFAGFTKDFDRFFNNYYKYPLVVFYERSQVNDTEIAKLRNMTRSPTFFQPLLFTIPPFINLSTPLERCAAHKSQGIGYKHMCRFQAKTLYEHPIMQTEGLEYVWRLDDDSFLRRNVTFDPFRFMKEHKIRYGYIGSFGDNSCWIVGLWKAANDYWDRLGISQKRDCPEGSYYYNNFEISALSVWHSSEYKQYIEYIDRLGGIYYHRWGDATIKTLAISRLLNTNEIFEFKNIGYRHNVQVMS